METNLSGRLRNTPLPKSHALIPLFEAVVNSIHAIEDTPSGCQAGHINIEIQRDTQGALQVGASATDNKITGFTITDNGAGFNEGNFKSFCQLDSEHKADRGCRGIGRLLWLKAFNHVKIKSSFITEGQPQKTSFSFSARKGVDEHKLEKASPGAKNKTVVELIDLQRPYDQAIPKTLKTIAGRMLEHCLWYFLREGGCPSIKVIDGEDTFDLDALFEQEILETATHNEVTINGVVFQIAHVKFKHMTTKAPSISFCAGTRLVLEESLIGKIPGLYNRLGDQNSAFNYSCYVQSPFLDENVRPERTGFDIPETVDGLFSEHEISQEKINRAIYSEIRSFLNDALQQNIAASKERLEKYTAEKSPKYRPILNRLSGDEIHIDPDATDREVEAALHKQYVKLEQSIFEQTQSIISPSDNENPESFIKRIQDYMADVDIAKKSDLASYVSHRKIVIELVKQAIQRGPDHRYPREELLHQLILPMRIDSHNESFSPFSPDCNLWLIDEKLSFHNYLASDKPLSSMPILDSAERKEPDIAALSIYDTPHLISENQHPPLASITVVEIKRPMRNDVAQGENNDPIEQCLNYLQNIREGNVQTPSGRPIINPENIPGYCYVICDITSGIKHRCRILDLRETSDKMGYFGYNQNCDAYIEVISYDKLVDSAEKRNRAFFDKLGIPAS